MPKNISIQNSKITFTNNEDSSLTLFGLTLDSGYVTLPRGNTLQRPTNPEPGMMRYNNQTNQIEGYDGVGWRQIIQP